MSHPKLLTGGEAALRSDKIALPSPAAAVTIKGVFSLATFRFFRVYLSCFLWSPPPAGIEALSLTRPSGGTDPVPFLFLRRHFYFSSYVSLVNASFFPSSGRVSPVDH